MSIIKPKKHTKRNKSHFAIFAHFVGKLKFLVYKNISKFSTFSKDELLREAYRLAKANDGAPGIDGKDFEDIEREGLEGFLEGIRQELLERTYRPLPNRRVEIPKGNGKTRTLGIPTIKDRVVQGALKLILEPIFEADFKDCSYGYRPKRHAHQAIDRVTKGILHAEKGTGKPYEGKPFG